jgi:hypothetical protein
LDIDSVVPAMDKTLQVWEKEIDNVKYAATIPENKYVWRFIDTGDGWTYVSFSLHLPRNIVSTTFRISNQGKTLFWTIASAFENSAVSFCLLW